MKKILSVILSMSLLAVPIFAVENDDTAKEVQVDRYAIYQSVVEKFESQEQTRWSSGDEEDNYGSHGMIAMVGIDIADSNSAINDYFEANRTAWLIEYSVMPDIDEANGILYYGHFYGPDGTNYLGRDDTAYSRFRDHYEDAVIYYNSGNYLQSTRSLGRAIHYISDICNPHHAMNAIAINSNHGDFEDLVETAREENMVNPLSITTTYLNGYTTKSLKRIADDSATFARGYFDIANAGHPTFFDDEVAALAINPTFCNAQKVAGGVIYKFCEEVGMF